MPEKNNRMKPALMEACIKGAKFLSHKARDTIHPDRSAEEISGSANRRTGRIPGAPRCIESYAGPGSAKNP